MPDRNLRVFLAIAVVVVAAVAAVAFATRPIEPQPATGAAALVPGDALLYIHLSTDPSRPAVRRALSVAARFPDFPLGAAAALSRVGAILTGSAAASVDFASQVRPWLGREVAFALLNTTTSTAGSLIVVDVKRRNLATTFALGEGAVPVGVYRGREILRYRSGTTLAFVGHYVVLGQPASVRAAINAADGRIRSLAASPQYRAAAAGEPADRVLDAYVSVDGVRRVLSPQGGVLGALGVLLYQQALTGTTITVSPVSAGVRVRIHSALDPTLARVGGAPASQFAATLAGVLPQGTLLLLDVMGLDRVAPRVLAASAEGGIAGRVGPLLRRLGAALASEGVDVGRLGAIFSGETAVAVSPGGPARSGAARAPALVIVARTRHEEATRTFLAQLETPLAQLFPPPSNGPGQAPEFNDVPVGGITVHQLSLTAGLQLDYAVFNGLVVVSTSLEAIGAIVRHAHSLADDSGYQAALGDRPSRVTSLLFLHFSQLLNLAVQTGLTHSARISELRPDLAKIRAIGLASTRGEDDTTSELFLQIP